MQKASSASAKENRSLVWILGLAGFVSAADNWFVSPSLSAIAAGFGASVAEAGLVLTAYMLPYGFMQPIYGFFSDSGDKVKMLRLIVFGLALGTGGSALAGSLPALCVLRAVTGFFAAGIIAVSLSLIGDRVPEAERQASVGKFMGIVFAGQGLSAGLGGVLTRYVSWRGAFFFFAATAIAAALLLQALPNGSAESHRPQSGFSGQCRLALFSPKGKVIFPMAFFAGFLLLGVYGYLGSFLHERVRLDFMQSGLVVMFYGFACLAVGTRVGKLVHRIGKKNVVSLGEGLAVAATALLCVSSLLRSWPLALLATVCLGAGYISVQSTLATMSLRAKLLVGFSGVALFSLLVGLVGLRNLSTVNGLTQSMYQRHVRGLSYVKEADANLLYANRSEKNFLLETSEEGRATRKSNWAAYVAAVKDNLDKAEPLTLSDEGKKSLAAAKAAYEAWVPASAKVLELGAKESLAKDSAAEAYSRGEARDKTDLVDSAMAALTKVKERNAAAAAEQSKSVYASSVLFLSLVIAGALIMLACRLPKH